MTYFCMLFDTDLKISYNSIMMKSLKLTLVLLFASLIAFAQTGNTYFVAHIKGQISEKSTGNVLKVGDQFSADAQVVFGDASAKAIVIDMTGERLLLQADQAGQQSSENEFIAFVKDAILPLKENIQLSTRGGFDPTVNYRQVDNFAKLFGDSRYVIIGNELKVGAHETSFPINETKRFIYRYETDTRPVNKKLSYEGNQLIINREALYKTKGEKVDPAETIPVELIYFDFDKNEAKRVVKFEPLFVDEETLMLELQSVATFLENNNIMPENKIRDELFDFVIEVHGPINKNVFNDWLASKEILTKG